MTSSSCATLAAFLLIFAAVSSADFGERPKGFRWFYRGRFFDGNVGLPADDLMRAADDKFITEEYFDQLVDHFTPTDVRTWKQRFQTNTKYFKKGGPVFLMIGGEGPASIQWMSNGDWIENAKEFHALCFQVEHRFYGKSHPFPDLSVKSLNYLNSEQALADLAFFIEAMNKRYKLPADTKWVVFGGSYSGSLAAWMRVQYPHLVHAASSASGPLVAELDFGKYYVVVRNALANHSKACVQAVSDGSKQVGKLLEHPLGERKISDIFRLCDPIKASNKDDVSNFYQSIADNFAGVVQYNNDNRITNSTAAKITIKDLCNIMENETLGAPVHRLAEVNSFLLNTTKTKCLDYAFDKLIKDFRNESLNATTAEGGRQWTWQTCTEFGFFQTSTLAPELFGNDFPVEFFNKQCRGIFGPQFTDTFLQRAIDRTNTIYGGLHLRATRVVYVHGSIDPWHALGMLRTLNPDAPAIYIEGTAHCANIYPSSPKDLKQLTKARQMTRRYLRLWLRESDYSSSFNSTNELDQTFY